MEFRHLICFKRVAELEHMTRAADELYMSQSHLSHVISELEDELGVKLFDREGRGIRLNPCGREFYTDVSELFTQYDDACRRVRASYLRQTTQLTLVTNVSTYMPGLIKATQKAMPAVGVQQYSAPRRRVIRMLLAGEADYAICCPIITDEPDLESTLLRVEHGVIIYPEGHWLAQRGAASLTELQNERFINVGVGYGTRDIQDIYFRKLGIVPNIAIETTDTASIYDYVEKGLGIALASKASTRRHPIFKDRYAEITEGTYADIGLTWRKDSYISDSMHAFSQVAADFFAKLE